MGPRLRVLHARIVACRACPRLVEWRERVARTKVRRFREEDYWGRPVPGFGDPRAKILVLGLAPGAHGANRTGRVFTGDRSGEFLFAALHRAGLCNHPRSVSKGDGLALADVFISLAARCVPPDNHPLPGELERCAHFLDEEAALLPRVRVVLALGAIAWNAALGHLVRRGIPVQGQGLDHRARARPRFAHGAEVSFKSKSRIHLVGSFHVSQQNTQTGRLTAAMFDRVLRRVRTLARDQRPFSPARRRTH
jgi:uracil-DNA glycosylase